MANWQMLIKSFEKWATFWISNNIFLGIPIYNTSQSYLDERFFEFKKLLYSNNTKSSRQVVGLDVAIFYIKYKEKLSKVGLSKPKL